MRRGRELGAAGNWSKALTEYIRAAQLIPTDISARYGLAMALFKIGQLDQAQQQFQGIVRIQPQNADAWRGLAELYSQAGNTSRAVQTYEQLKDLYQRTNRNREVGEVLQQIIKIDPGNAPAYRELMDRAKARGDRKTAASLILTLGRHYQSVGELDNALSSANEALFLIPDLPEAKSFKEELTRPAADNFSANGSEPGEVDPRDFTTSEMREATIQGLIASAEESLNRGDTGPALRNYELAVEAGSTRSDVFYSIGKLYADQGQTDRAVEYLRKATGDSDYAVSAYYSIGQAYAAEERFPEAEGGYWDAINHIDLQTISRDDIDDLIDMYDELGDVLLRQGKDKEASDLYNRLVNFINSRQFRTDKTAVTIIKARELNDKLQPPTTQMVPSEADGSMTSSIRFGNEVAEAATEEGGQPVTDGLSSTNLPPVGTFANPDAPVRAPVVVQAIPSAFPYRLIEMDPLPAARPYLRAAEEFMKQRKFNAAVDASQELIRYFPYYLPAQAILAEIMVALDRVEQARTKYQFVVDVYQLRQDTPRSLEVYKRLGTLSADNIALRTKLANLLIQNNQQDAAADVLLATINSYVNNGQLERALEECRRLRQMAPASVPVRLQFAELLTQLERYAEAMPELRQVLEHEPGNIRALALLNINGFLANQAEIRWASLQTMVERARQKAEDLKTLQDYYQRSALFYGQPAIYYALGCLYLEGKQMPQAERAFEQGLEELERGPKPGQNIYGPLLHWELGRLTAESQPNTALNHLEIAATQAEQVDPAQYAANSMVYGKLPGKLDMKRQLAQGYRQQGQTDKAIGAYRQLKKLVPFDRQVHTELADLYFNQGHLNDALGELAELVSHFEETGQTDSSIEVLREMVGLAPSNIMVRDKLSQVYHRRGMIDEGLKELDELAELQRKNGRLKDAVRTLQRAAEVYWMLGKQEPAYELYDRIVRISPGDVEARQQLVNRNLMAGRVKEAVEEQRMIAQICLQSDNTQEAIAALHQVIGLAPEDTRAYFQLASVLSSINEYGQAYRLYQRILRLEPDNQKARSLLEQAQKKAVETGQVKAERT